MKCRSLMLAGRELLTLHIEYAVKGTVDVPAVFLAKVDPKQVAYEGIVVIVVVVAVAVAVAVAST